MLLWISCALNCLRRWLLILQICVSQVDFLQFWKRNCVCALLCQKWELMESFGKPTQNCWPCELLGPALKSQKDCLLSLPKTLNYSCFLIHFGRPGQPPRLYEVTERLSQIELPPPSDSLQPQPPPPHNAFPSHRLSKVCAHGFVLALLARSAWK